MHMWWKGKKQKQNEIEDNFIRILKLFVDNNKLRANDAETADQSVKVVKVVVTTKSI